MIIMAFGLFEGVLTISDEDSHICYFIIYLLDYHKEKRTHY